VRDARGSLALWVGGSANRNRDAFELKFKSLVQQIEKELKPVPAVPSEKAATSIAGR